MENIKICKRCIYDGNVPGISFDEEGICNYCRNIEKMEQEYPNDERGEKILKGIITRIKHDGRNKKYDCMIGVSGGCDSSFMVYKMKELGLRPLAVHFDNTWNSTIATENIKKVLKKLDVDLYTLVVDNKEYDDIYRSFLKSGVKDIEAPTDIAYAATLRIAAEKFKIKYILEGHNFRTEGISPLGMLYMDGKYIESVQKKHGTMKLRTYPNMKLGRFIKWLIFSNIKMIRPLYYVEYDKDEVMKFLEKDFDWKWYGGHHLENRFTAFYHSYFMPRRFGIDSRINGFSALIRSGQLDREKGLKLLKEPPYLEDEIISLIKKRLGFSDDEFERLMTMPHKTFRDFRTYKKTFEIMRPFFWLMYKLDRIPKSFYDKYTRKLK
ncbi:MAG: N-acetyl sugar amidotransferase [Ignavibacteriae bacterium]|nr:N-acetyl sugar amidotransferase [Ignavibacteriota bacterium]